MWAVVCLIGTIICLIWIWLKRHYSYWESRNVLQEEPKYLLGNMSGLGSKYTFRDINQRIYQKYKGRAPLVGCYIFIEPAAFVTDLDLIKQIMVEDFNKFPDRGLFHNVRDDPLTGNLLLVDGEEWKVLRHKLSPVFSSGKIKYMYPSIVRVGGQLLEACLKIVENNSGSIEAKNLCALYTTDVIGTCAFGIECNSLKDPNGEFRKMGKEVIEKPRHGPIVQTFMFNSPKMARKLRLKNFKDKVTEFFIRVVRETVEYRQKNNVTRNDFMDLLIELKEKRDLAGALALDENDLNNGLTLLQVAAQALVFFVAGFDTSSTTMSFCLFELAMNPSVQDKLRDEVKKVLKKYNQELTYEAIKEMKYLDMVISETLRKHSVLPHLIRVSSEDFHVPGTGIILEKKTRILIPIDAIHNDPEYYPNPECFDPERFNCTESQNRHPYSYLPFGEGPRNCIGKRFGLLQAQVGLAILINNFRFKTNPDTEIPIKIDKKNFLLAPQSGISLTIEKVANGDD